MTVPRLHGIFTPLVTPACPDESPDLASIDRLVRFQIQNGIHGLWVLGTTGEFASFDEHERAAVAGAALQAAEGRIPAVVNVSDASTRGAIRHGLRAQSLGADAVAATPPYYYPHTQDEVLAHYRTIREAVDLPLFIYNIPQTVRVRVELATAQQLAEEGTVAGIKDSQNDLEWFRQLALFVRRHGLPFSLFVGTRSLIDAAILVGAHGAIPSIANAFPDLCVTVYNAIQRDDLASAARMEARIIELESVAAAIPGGSRNASVLRMLKEVLTSRGILESPTLTSPLRGLTPDEARTVRDRVDEIAAVRES